MRLTLLPRRELRLLALLLLGAFSALPAAALQLELEPAAAADASLVLGELGALYSQDEQPTIIGRARAEAGSRVQVTIDGTTQTALVDARGIFEVTWSQALEAGVYEVEAELLARDGASLATAAGALRVQLKGTLPRQPLAGQPQGYALPVGPEPDDFIATTERWRLPIDGASGSKGKWDPYHQNKLKGDMPIHGEDRFLVLTGISDTLLDGFQVPTPSSVSTNNPGSQSFFGEGDQALIQQNVLLTADYYQGSTVFKPFDWRLRGTVAINGNHLDVRENAAVNPDVRRGTDRTDGRLALQELFFEYKIKDLSANFDFLSVRVGVQPFNSDFRGFVFTDTNLGVRLFGNAANNLWQYNLAFFERLEKDTNSGLNTFELREQRVAIANVYRQDFLIRGYTAQWSLHYLQDDATFLLDKNGFLARPDPVGSAQPHEIEALYLGWTGFGHFRRINIDHAFYYVDGEDSLNPIAGRDIFAGRDDVDISAFMAALELSIDKNWYRPKIFALYSSGDDDPTDRDAEGFAAIFENPAFAGGGFSFWQRLGIRLAGTGVSLINRGSLVPDLRSSKEEGQPNFVNPGLLLTGVGLDLDLTPELRVVLNANYLQFDSTEVIDLLTFQADTDRDIGLDLAVGVRWRPYFNNNVILLGSVAAFVPGDGFEDIYEDDDTLYGAFANLRLTF